MLASLSTRWLITVETPHHTTISTYLKQPLPYNKDIELIRYFDDKKGFGLSVMSNKTVLWTRHIQLCVMYNTVINTVNIGFLLSYYIHFFNHITLISGTEIVTKANFIPDFVQLFNCNSNEGRYQHRCLKMCLENPARESVEGFLYIADDMFVDIAKMSKLDRTKLWAIPVIRLDYNKIIRESKEEVHKRWYWFGAPEYTEDYLQQTIEKLPREWIEALKRNGFPSNFETHAPSDIYFIPRSLVPRLVKVISFMVKATDHLFCEVALPLSVGIITQPSERQVLFSGYLWGNQRTLPIKEDRAKVAHFVHPLKLSDKKDLKLWKNLMEDQLRQATSS